jgi:hypothetical protein
MWMAEGRRRDEWDQTAQICKTIADVNRGKGDPFDVSTFHPMHWKPRKRASARSLILHMRSAFQDLNGLRVRA